MCMNMTMKKIILGSLSISLVVIFHFICFQDNLEPRVRKQTKCNKQLYTYSYRSKHFILIYKINKARYLIQSTCMSHERAVAPDPMPKFTVEHPTPSESTNMC